MKFITLSLILLAFASCKKEKIDDPCPLETDSTKLEILWKVENIIDPGWRINTSIRPILFNGNVLTSNQKLNFQTIFTMRDATTGEPIWEKEMPNYLSEESIFFANGKLYMDLQSQITSLDLATQELELLYDLPNFSARYVQVLGKHLVTHYSEPFQTPLSWRSEDKILLIGLETKAVSVVYSYLHSYSDDPYLLDPTLWLSVKGDTMLTFLKITDTLATFNEEFELITLDLSQKDTVFTTPITGAGSYTDRFIVHDRRIFVPTEDAVFCFDATFGYLLWKVDLNQYFGTETILLLAENKLIVFCRNYCSETLALDPSTGATLWKKDYLELPSVVENIAVHDGKAFYSYLRAMKAIDLSTGCLLWYKPQPNVNLLLGGGTAIDGDQQKIFFLDTENIYGAKL